MIHVKDHKQRDMFHPFEHLGPKRLALLESSWAHLFREEILHKLPVEKLFPSYHAFKGRKTKELYAMLGIVLLQQMQNLTDEETGHQFAFNILWHYALNITDPSDFSAYVSPRTLWTMRDQVAELVLDGEILGQVTGALSQLFDLDPSQQRLDSVHIFSNMAHLGRIRLFVRTIRKFLVNLKRQQAELYQALEEDLIGRYAAKKDGWFAVKPSESTRTLEQVGNDCFGLVERFRNQEAVVKLSSYKLLVRLFNEQCVVEKNETGAQVVVKPNKEVPSDSLQNPSDPEAGYCGHKGQGYQMQVMETYSPERTQPNLITHVKVEAAHESDAQAVLPAIEDAQERDLAPTQLLADTLYGSDDNVANAKEHGVELISPTPGTASDQITLTDFTFSETDELIACPQGQAPQRTRIGKQGGQSVYFDKTTCDHCPRQSDCPAKRTKKNILLRYDAKALRLARRRAHEKTEAFRDVYRYRAGVEATMSDLDRRTGLKHLRVRGLRQVRLAATLKAAGLNLLRATAFRNRKTRRKSPQNGGNTAKNGHVLMIKERFNRRLSVLCRFGGVLCFGDDQRAAFMPQAA